MKIGFLGTGIMGAPMAAHLLDGGHQYVARCILTVISECNGSAEEKLRTPSTQLLLPAVVSPLVSQGLK